MDEKIEKKLEQIMESEIRSIAFAQTIKEETESDDESYRKVGRFAAKAIIENDVEGFLLSICGWSVETLIEKSEELMKDHGFIVENGCEPCNLPENVIVNIEEIEYNEGEDNLEEAVSEYLSDTYGYCHKGFRLDNIEYSGEVRVCDIVWDIEE